MSSEVKRWKKKTWLNVDILYEDEFYARTPDTDNIFPPTVKAKYTVIGQNTTRSTLEEIPIEPKTEEKTNEETTKENPTMDIPKSTQV
tara:strand:- start:1854 stop:2117 length:264 start_codon:yes stop_codon:yes gene_type:complete